MPLQNLQHSKIFIGDNKNICPNIKEMLDNFKQYSFSVEQTDCPAETLNALRSDKYDIYLVNWNLEEGFSFKLFDEVEYKKLKSNVILLVDENDEKSALKVIGEKSLNYVSNKQTDSQEMERLFLKLLKSNSHISGLLNNESVYRRIIENLSVMFYAVETEPPYSPLYISPAFASLGYDLDEWWKSNDLWLSILHPDDKERILLQTEAAMKKGGNADYKYRLFKKDGSICWIHDQGKFARNENGEIICWQGIMLDITEQKRAEDLLRESEKRYRQMFEENQSVKLIIDSETWKIVDANPAASKFYGYTTEEFKAKKISELNTAPAWKISQSMEKVRRKKENHFIAVHRLASGEERDVEIFSNVLELENKNLFYSIIYDITERIQAEKSLKDSEERYRNLFENANDLIYVHDLEGNYLSINQAGERVFGYTREETLKMNFRDIVTPESFDYARKMLARKIAGEKLSVYEIDCIHKNGKKVSLEINSRIVCKDGKPVAVQGVARDITERRQAEENLRESEAKFRTVAETASDAILTIDETGLIIFVNAAAEKIFGYPADEMTGQNISLIMPERMREKHCVAMLNYMQTGGKNVSWNAVELIGLHKKGYEISLEFSFAEYAREGQRFFTSVIRDITERKNAEEALKNSEMRFRDLFENANDLIYTHDLDGNFTSLNRAGEIVTGYTREEALKLNIAQVVAPDYLEKAHRMIALKIAGELPTAYELDIITKGGRRVTLELSTRFIYQDNVPVNVQGIARNITDRKRAEEKLQYSALYDPLTHLPNRTNFMNHLSSAVRRAENKSGYRFAVLFLDLDRFKVINDSLGHAVGDKLLVAIADKLKLCVRPNDVIARFGGDEFTLLLAINEDADAVQVAERIQQNLSKPIKLGNYEVFTSASIGIITSNEIKRSPEDVLRDADAAMYQAKETGKARYEIFDHKMHVRNMNLLQIETDLRRAVERNEFEVFYQPIVELDTGRICEFEALIRWNHPEKGLIMPDQFISVAEETGLIIPIGEWILRESCHQIKIWQDEIATAAELSISVNLSAKQLMHPILIKQIKQILKKANLKSEFLKLEVTESMVMEHSEFAERVLEELQNLGVSLSTDDFGTGYSSLSYLHQFPFDRLKIDRSFVSKLNSDVKSEAIVRTILLLGQNLEIEVTAEGIENAQQLWQLRSLGCSLGQGYLYSKPVNAENAANLLKKEFLINMNSMEMPFTFLNHANNHDVNN